MTQIAIVLYPDFTALDFIGPYEVLRFMPDTEVRFVWHQPGPITADSGVLVIGATHSFEETPAPDVVLVPGGPGTTMAARDEELLEWLRRVHPTTTWTTSVCSGSLVLAAAGLLEGQRATSHWSTLPLLKPFGVTPVGDERIVRADDGRVVTAAGVSAGIDLGLWLAGHIAGEERAKAIQLSIEYDPQPPFDSGHMSKASAATKATATAGLAKDTFKPAIITAGAMLLWDGALATVRRKGSRRRSLRTRVDPRPRP
ncbi:DJ-1/PfpI family protein [Mycobacteroides chelonae]|jgi:transcriptional regulator GlxA family with amidase domain|uniref:DJ-1/PfpI family protein n=1 Tax=Mycobacteroides chelonae TaxID=1774 RepID=A0AB73TY48_MYCCH|nr:DJ-1/PfpI family protein [Mycobacteroides chelonae]MBF9317249.1 DJ-1/PfpI family protein [Mycobacteroides chelonae]OHT66990.1 glutamine amidotransferase [Mycobacteroides chelonae]OHT68624.1 glutamine amidotransferase [Mycobacteroides chelonae]OHT83529.1 glutamine amidotransferase [Mycobacteroides chelonae]OHU33847.1 glutamine amidotransferase [Mycobacteroides chelonae]